MKYISTFPYNKHFPMQLTSTTSLSDDSENDSTPTNHGTASNNTTVTQLPLDSPVDNSRDVVLVNIDETSQPSAVRPRTSASFRKPKSFAEFNKAPSAKSSDDIRLLFMDEVRPIAGQAGNVAPAPVNDKRFDDIDLIQHNAQGTVCV